MTGAWTKITEVFYWVEVSRDGYEGMIDWRLEKLQVWLY